MGEEKVSRRGYVKYAATGVVIVAAAGAGAYYATRPKATPTPTPTPTPKPTPTPTPKPTPTEIEVIGATPAERALNAARQYVQIHKVQEGTVLNCIAPAGAKGHYTEEFFKPFEEACDGKVKLNYIPVPPEEMVAKYMTEAVEKSGAYDHISVVPVSYLADFVEAGLCADCTGWMQKYKPDIDTGPCAYPPAVINLEMKYKGRLYGFAYDYDIWLNHYKLDYFNDPDEQKAFESEFHYPLRPPQTWKEFEDVSKFFYRPDENLYPTWEYKVLYWELFNFKLRFITKGKYFFDKEMHPNIDRQEGIDAFNDMLRAQKYQPKESWVSYWDVNYPWYVTEQEDGPTLAFLISWTSLMKFCYATKDKQGKPFVDRVALAMTPGYEMSNGEIRKAGFIAASHVLTVNKYSKHPELTYLFNQYLADPQVSTKEILEAAGYYEEHRTCHFSDPEFVRRYRKENAEVQLQNLDYLAPDLNIAGVTEYDNALDVNLNAVFKGTKDPVKALRDTHDAWEEITDRIGRDSQIEAWLALTEGFGPKLKPYMSF
ncbi:MAG: extracellular solute-binding protein [Candidatus Bathyarchaeia archaeon]